jgi:DNA-binding SARP family transcriptional activator/predicted ATPase
MSQLVLKFLGSPEVRCDSRLVAFPTRKALALLIYLAAEGGVHSRDKITALLWPESGATQGRTALRTTLTILRAALGTAVAHLAATRDSLRFQMDTEVDLDLLSLHAAARATRQLPLAASADRGGSAQPLLAQLQNAADRYRSDFLDGFSLSDAPEFDNWASVQRETWHRNATHVFDWLSQLQLDGGEPMNAIETAARWIARDSLNEAAHRRLMLSHFTAGDRSAALHAYAACCAILERELNAEPSPDTEALAQRIRIQPPASRADAATSRTTSAKTPLVGRAAEHLELVSAYRLARRNQPQAVLLEGEPGIGKTRLAQDFLTWAAAQGAEVLHGRAFEIGGQVPYQIVIDALRFMWSKSAGGHASGESFAPAAPLSRSLSIVWLAELTRLLPELRDHYPDVPAPLPLNEGEARARLFEAVARLGQALAERAPAHSIVLFLDDLQWADAASLDLLAYAGRRWAAANTPILLIFAARSEDTAQINDWLLALSHELPLTRRMLFLLSFADTVQLIRTLGVESLVRPDALAGFGQQLFADTQGHPFFIIQTLKSLSEGDEYTLRTGVPTGVRDLIRARLSRLSSYAMVLCQAGTILGAGFDFDRLCSVADMNERDGLPALEELLRRGLLREIGLGASQSIPTYGFSHDRIREVADADLSAARRRVLHRRALEAGGILPAELVRHALAAGLLERAFHLSLRAGEEAVEVFALRNAIAHYDQANALMAQLHVPIADRCTLYLARGRTYELASEWEAARTDFQNLLALAREMRHAGIESTALTRLAAVAARGSFDLHTAATLLQEAKQIAEQQHDTVSLIEIEANLAQTHLYLWNVQGLIAHAEHALGLARDLAQPELIARCLNMLAYAGTISSQWETMAVQAEEARSLYAQHANRFMEADCLALISAGRTHSGRLREGIEAGRAAFDICRKLESDWGQANSAWYLAHALLEAGAYTQALEVAHMGVAAARGTAHPPLLMFNLAILGRIHRTLFALDAALEAHLECQAIAQALPQPLVVEWAATELCADYAEVGDWHMAYVQVQRALPIRTANPTVTPFAGQTRWYETEALIRGGDITTALEDVQRFDRQIGGRDRYRIAYLRAMAVLTPGETDQANAYRQAAVALAKSINLPGELWVLYAGLGQASQAAAIVQSLATAIDDEAIRARFLVEASRRYQ